MKKNLIFIIAISFVEMLAMTGCGCDTSEQTGSLNGHGYVDLGLPSGTLWATSNIGADDPNDAGDYFAYGKTTPWTEDDMKNSYRPSIIPKEYVRVFDVFYVSFLGHDTGIQDLYFHFSNLNKSDDAATYNWGDAWRMPTKEDCEELMSECCWEWISHNFQKGYKVTGPNGNSIFLPITDYRLAMCGFRLFGILWPCSTSQEENGYYRTSSCFWGEIDSEKGWSSPVFVLGGTPGSPIEIKNFTPAANNGVPIRPVSSGNGSRKTSSVKETKTKGSCNGHDWVDLGLPSGTKWATCNVGANKPEDDGNYYAWGETRTKSSYTENNYTYSSSPTTLPSSADAATVNWGVGWRMPTKDEFKELKDKCTWKWVSDVGYKIIGPNDNSIFLPAASYLDYIYTDLQDAPPKGFDGFYWSSSLYSDGRAWFLYFYSDNYDMRNECSFVGLSVRPVFNPN